MFYSGNLNTEFEPLTNFNEYEIKLVDGNAKIRRISDGFEPKYTLHKYTGYYQLRLSKRYYLLHRIIAQHYINHDDQHDVIDHIDRNRINYNIMNLRWTTQQENTKNKSSQSGVKYKYVDDIPDNSVSILRYNNHFFKDYYYANNTFYYWTGINFRILPKLIDRNDYEYVWMVDINNKKAKIYINKWDKIKGW